MNSHSSLTAAADARKARLAALKNLKRKAPSDEDSAPQSPRRSPPPIQRSERDDASSHLHADAQLSEVTQEEKDITSKYLSGRNYDIESQGPKLGYEQPPTLSLKEKGEKTLEERAADLEREIREKAQEEEKKDEGVDIFKLQPKKPNWDLKRDLDQKLEILNVRTDNAIAQLVRERISGAKNKAVAAPSNGQEGQEIGMQGIDLVEGARLREQEEKEDAEREDAEMMA